MKSLDSLTSTKPLLTYPKGHILIEGGSPPKHAIALVKGAVKMLTYTIDGDEVLIHIYGPGVTFPILSMAPGAVNRYWFVSMTSVQVYEIPYLQYTTEIQRDPELTRAYLAKMISAVGGLTMRVQMLAQYDVEARVAGVLLYVGRHFGTPLSTGQLQLTLAITHQDIASFIGSSREAVSRAWEKLMQKQLVTLDQGTITIVDRERLQEIAQYPYGEE